MNAPLLAFPQDIEEYILDTDASDFGIGGVLNQVIGREERVICFVSKTRWCTTRKVLLCTLCSITGR